MNVVALIVCLSLLAVALNGFIRTRHLIAVGTNLAHKAIRYEQSGRSPRILIIGDSTAVGTGASESKKSLAGLVGQHYPTALIRNHGVNGAKVSQAIRQLEREPEKNWDIVILHIGGNDTVRFTNLSRLRADFHELLKRAKKHGHEVVHVSTGSLGTAQLLPWGSRWMFTLRTRQTRAIFLEEAQKLGIHTVDLFREKADDPFAQDAKTYYAADLFHPSDAGYADWFSRIQPVLDRLHSR